MHGNSSMEAWADWKILAVEASEFEHERLKSLKFSTEDELKSLKFEKRMKFMTEVKVYITSEFKVVPQGDLDARVVA